MLIYDISHTFYAVEANYHCISADGICMEFVRRWELFAERLGNFSPILDFKLRAC